MLLDGAFTVLLLIGGVSAVTVPPPANVTVKCENAKITVSWDYSKKQPHTTFRVNVSGSSRILNVSETADHQFDLSRFVWKSEEDYKDYLYVIVTAIQGGSQSKGEESNSFSFNRLKTVDKRCTLDFPPVEVNVDDSGATVSFLNPVHFYEELKQTIKESPPVFRYIVTVRNGTALIGEYDEVCTVEHDKCKRDVPFPEGVKKCVTVKGILSDSNSISLLVFRESKEICAPDSSTVHVVTITAVLFCILVFIITVVVVCICKTNAWTMQTPDTPKFLGKSRQEAQKICPVSRDEFSPVSVEKPQKRLSVSSEDSDQSEDVQDSSACSHQYPPAGPFYTDSRLLESSNQELERAGLLEGSRSDSDSADDSVKTECVSMGSEEDEQESVSPYDCPHAVMLDMDDGDMVIGYKG